MCRPLFTSKPFFDLWYLKNKNALLVKTRGTWPRAGVDLTAKQLSLSLPLAVHSVRKVVFKKLSPLPAHSGSSARAELMSEEGLILTDPLQYLNKSTLGVRTYPLFKGWKMMILPF